MMTAVFFSACKTTKPIIIDKNNNALSNAIGIKKLVPDTTEYLKAIYADRQKYIGKEAKLLFENTKLKIKSYSIMHDRLKCFGIYCSFLNEEETAIRHGNNNSLPYLTIRFETPILRSEAERILGRAAGEWRMAEQDFFGKQIVKDLN